MDVSFALDKAKLCSVAVIGDVCVDLTYQISQSSEISVETGLPVHSVPSFSCTPGGAAQVATLCKDIGFSEVALYGVVGNDLYGRELTTLLVQKGVQCSSVLVQEKAWDTHVYHKIRDGREELPRYDIGLQNVLDPTVQEELLRVFSDSLASYDLVIINQQQQQGIHTSSFIAKLSALIAKNSGKALWLCDARDMRARYPLCIQKMNAKEAAQAVQELGLSLNDSYSNPMHAYASTLAKHWQTTVIMTLGQYGAIANDMNTLYEENGIHIIKEVDAVGAGDAFLAGLALSLSSGPNLADALHGGNLAAGIYIQPWAFPEGINARSLMELEGDINHIYNYALAQDVRKAVYYKETEIEIINAAVLYSRKKKFPKFAIFDLDGTISSLREGWEVVMKESMFEFIAGPLYQQLSINDYRNLEEKIEVLIKKTTGVQTIIQMVEMCHLIEEFGYVKSEDMLTAEEYKEIYANKIRKVVKQKIGRFSSNSLHLEDFTMKGALPFLTNLRDHGVRIYLASGTDQVDVANELKEFGYFDLFDGGVFGSVGDTENDPKKLVMQKIRERIEQEGETLELGDCVVFGDGPVEIREGRKQNFITIGLISDEKQRYGMNLQKRERLILAGADLLIPDYSWSGELMHILGWK